ncbi:DUF6950 family protein [Paenochrobactrum sp. BZR 201-1]
MERSELLKSFIEGWKDVPVVWGESDCTAYAAKWVEIATGCPMARLADYSSKDEALEIIAQHGGLLALWSNALAQAGIFENRGDPQLGDVALVRTADYGDIGVIIANDGACILRTETGTRFLRPRSFVKVWAI